MSKKYMQENQDVNYVNWKVSFQTTLTAQQSIEWTN